MAGLGTDDEGVLHHLVDGGFLTLQEITAAMPERDASEIRRRYTAKLAADARPGATFLFDRLDEAFTRLEADDHVVTLHRAGPTLGEARARVADICRERGGSEAGVRGGVFYTDPDLHHAIDEGTLRLAFFALGPNVTSCEASLQVLMPRILRQLTDAGLPATWNGDQHTKIEIEPITWSKRSPGLPQPVQSSPASPSASLLGRLGKRLFRRG